MQAATSLESVSEFLPKHPKGPSSWFLLSAGGILLLGGMVKVLDLLARPEVPDMTDPIFAMPFRDLVLLVGVAELIVASLCLFTDRRTLSLGLLAWLVANLAAYRIGLWTMGWPHPYAWVAGLINGLNISPRIADLIIGVASAYLLVGSIAMLWFERRTAQAATFLKISCVSCGGHIEFPANAVGQKIQCPHCAKNITLLSPA
jgi:ribosomal protein S27E